jgi:hypothetical protein
METLLGFAKLPPCLNEPSEGLSVLQDSIDRYFKSTAPQIGRNPLQLLGFSELTNDLTGHY